LDRREQQIVFHLWRPLGGSITGALKSRFSNLIPQLVCVAIAFYGLYPTWDSTTVGQKVFGVMWLSFILGIFVAKPAEQAPPQAS
jgi:hypothetical protein